MTSSGRASSWHRNRSPAITSWATTAPTRRSMAGAGAFASRRRTARPSSTTGLAIRPARSLSSSPPQTAERQLQEALLLGDPLTDLSLAMEISYFLLVKDCSFVPIEVKILGSEIELARHGGAESTRLDFIGKRVPRER